jgi:hypothetical protein
VLVQIWGISKNPESLPGCKPYPLRKQWGIRPTHRGSHILVRHMQDVCQLSYAMDVHMEP